MPKKKKKESVAIHVSGCGGHRVVICRDSHIFWTIISQMVARLSALHFSQVYTQEDSWYSFLLEAE
jgi:hypothetical protein